MQNKPQVEDLLCKIYVFMQIISTHQSGCSHPRFIGA